jgi:hypothetical protein
MKEVIDLYAKLLIGTFSFIGPSFTLLISLFYTAFQQSQNRHRQRLNNLKLATTQNLTGDNQPFTEQIEETNKELKKLIRQNHKELQLLNPRRQVRRLFISLFGSIILVGFYYFQNSHFWLHNNEKLRIGTIITSGLCFVYCIRVLWQIFCTIIVIKTEERTKKAGIFLRRASE